MTIDDDRPFRLISNMFVVAAMEAPNNEFYETNNSFIIIMMINKLKISCFKTNRRTERPSIDDQESGSHVGLIKSRRGKLKAIDLESFSLFLS